MKEPYETKNLQSTSYTYNHTEQFIEILIKFTGEVVLFLTPLFETRKKKVNLGNS